MKDHDTTTAAHVPSVRIWLCGPLQIEWTDPTTGQTSVLTEQDVRSTTDATQALSLLKMLLCQPGRQAHRDWLLEQFWPEHAHSVAVHRFHNITSAFRKLLCPPNGVSLLPPITGKRDSSSQYTLPTYPRLWVDRDAALWNVEQAARMHRFGDDALPFWQRAYELLKRGPFLADEPYAEWAKERREPLEGCYRQCVHALWRLSVERHGEVGKAEALLLLRTYWQQHKTDEDILRPLMELLGEQERYQEAEEYYTQLLHALAELDDEDGRSSREPDVRTRDIRAYLQTKQIQRQREARRSRDTIEAYRPHALSQQDVSFSEETRGAIIDAMRELVAGNTTDQLQRQVLQHILKTRDGALLIKNDISRSHPKNESMAERKPFQSNASARRETIETRRQVLHQLLMIGSTALVLSPYAMLSPEKSEELPVSVLEELETITASYWRLCANASLDLLGTLSEHFRTVIHLLQQTLPHTTSQRICHLSGEIAQILGKTLFDLQEYSLAWSYYLFSLKAAQAASSSDLWAVGIGRMILLQIYREYPQEALPLLQEVHQLTLQNNTVVCWLSVVEAEVYAYLGDVASCDAALKRAKEISEHEPLGEDRYATGFNASRLAGYEGACFTRLHQPNRALLALQQALSLLDPQAIRRQSTLLTDMGIAYAQQGNIQKACQCAGQALSLTKQTKSRSVLERVRTVRSELEGWKEMGEVKELEKQLDGALTLITA